MPNPCGNDSVNEWHATHEVVEIGVYTTERNCILPRRSNNNIDCRVELG